MIVGTLEVELYLSGSDSLKYKRMIIRSLRDRLRKKFNVSVAETDLNDKWQRARLGLAVVGNSRAYVDEVLQKAFVLIDALPEAEIVDHGFDYT